MYKMSEIARDLGISRTTVSLCLSGKAEKYKISPNTVKRVREYVTKLGFVPNRMAQSLGAGRQKTLGILFGLTVFESKNQISMRYAIQQLSAKNWSYYIQHFDADDFVSSVAKMKGMGVSAIMVIGLTKSDRNLVKQLTPYLKDLPIFLIDYSFDGPIRTDKNIYRIGIDRRKSYFDAFEKLYKMGHTRIAIDTAQGEKFSAYQEFLQKHSFPFIDDLIVISGDSENPFKKGEQLAGQINRLIKEHHITAISLHDDQYAAGLISALLEIGVRVPEDISVMGFDNIDAASFYRVPLATIEVPVRKMVEMALSVIIGNKRIKRNSILEGKFITRKSVTHII